MLPLIILLWATAAVAGSEVRLTSGLGDQFQPDIFGTKVVWLDGINNQTGAAYSGVYLHTIGGSTVKINSGTQAHAPAIGSSGVVWEDLRNDSGGTVPNRDIYGYALPGGPESSVSTATGPETKPDTSGNRQVWQELRDDNWDIYRMPLSGSKVPLRLTTDPAQDDLPAWSPDGQHVAFRRCDEQGCAVLLAPSLGGPGRDTVRTERTHHRPGVR